MSLLDTTPAAGTPTPDSAPAGGSAPNQAPSGSAPSWRDSLPEELRSNASLGQFSDVTNLAKSYLHANSMVGKKGVIVPGEKATDEEWNAFHKSIGQPEMEKFDIKLPQEADVNQDVAAKFKELAFQAGMLPRQAQKFLDGWLPFEAEQLKGQKAKEEAASKLALEDLQKEWGQAYEQTHSLARKAATETLSDSAKKRLAESGLDSHPVVIQVVGELSKKLYSEDTIKGEASGGSMSKLSPREIQDEIATVFANPAYFDRNSPMHKVLTKRAEDLFKMQSG